MRDIKWWTGALSVKQTLTKVSDAQRASRALRTSIIDWMLYSSEYRDAALNFHQTDIIQAANNNSSVSPAGPAAVNDIAMKLWNYSVLC